MASHQGFQFNCIPWVQCLVNCRYASLLYRVYRSRVQDMHCMDGLHHLKPAEKPYFIVILFMDKLIRPSILVPLKCLGHWILIQIVACITLASVQLETENWGLFRIAWFRPIFLHHLTSLFLISLHMCVWRLYGELDSPLLTWNVLIGRRLVYEFSVSMHECICTHYNLSSWTRYRSELSVKWDKSPW